MAARRDGVPLVDANDSFDLRFVVHGFSVTPGHLFDDAATAAGMRGGRSYDNLQPPVLPLVFQDVEPGTVTLQSSHTAAVEAAQDEFADAVGSNPADPASQDYRRKWQREQAVSDQRLRAAIGAQAFARWQMEAYIRATKSGSGE